MPKYPELNGVPNKCLNTSPLAIEPLVIRAPFGRFDSAQVKQAGIISVDWGKVDGVSPWDLFNDFWNGKDQSVLKGRPVKESRGVGWGSAAEAKVLDRLLTLANNLIDKKSKYEPKSRDKIVSLARAAKEQLNAIKAEYGVWDNKAYEGKGAIGMVRLSLHWTEGEIKSRLKHDQGQIWPSQRQNARKDIRKSWDKAIRFLWCAVYAANQSKAYLENKAQAPKAQVGRLVIDPVKATLVPKRVTPKRVTLVPTTEEPDFIPGMPIPEEEEIVEEEIIEEEPLMEEPAAPAKKKGGMGLVVLGAAAVALLAMKK